MEGYVVILPIRHIPHPATGIHLVHIYTKATKTQKTKNIRDFLHSFIRYYQSAIWNREKYKAYILKQVPCILKYMACIFCDKPCVFPEKPNQPQIFTFPPPHHISFSFHNPRRKHLVSYRNTQTGQTEKQNAITCKNAEKTNTHAFTRRIILRPSVFYALTSGTYSENC